MTDNPKAGERTPSFLEWMRETHGSEETNKWLWQRSCELRRLAAHTSPDKGAYLHGEADKLENLRLPTPRSNDRG